MYKKLQMYYLSTSLPFIALLFGAVAFRTQIGNTLAKNPHPQINYAIFLLIVVGAIFILVNVHKLMQEGKKLSDFSAAVRRGDDPEKLQALALSFEDADIAYVLRMIAASSGRAIAQREQLAIEHELTKTATRLNNRHTLPQFMTNLLVGMGLLGTFIGLLATLGDIADLISGFSLIDPRTTNPMEIFQNMVSRMTAPMHSMGIAFSASLYGLLGSIILGFMMVAVRRCMQDIVSLLGSEVAQHFENAISHSMRNRRGEDAMAARSGVAHLGEGTAVGYVGGGSPGEPGQYAESVRVLMRIEQRLVESSRLQESALKTEIEQFAKQRGEMLKVVAEHSNALLQFRSELQSVSNQLGAAMSSSDRSNTELRAQLHESFSELIQSANLQGRAMTVASDLMARMADDSSESRRLMALAVDAGGDRQALQDELSKTIQTAFRQAAEQILHQKTLRQV